MVESTPQPQLPPSTIPIGFRVQFRDIPSEVVDEIADDLTFMFAEIGRQMNLSSLDGVTFAGDYPLALRELDRGYVSDYVLTPSEGRVVGIAMTPRVIRDGQLKNHIVINALVYFDLMLNSRGRRALQLVAHECAHVVGNAEFEKAFPGVLLRHRHGNMRDGTRWEIILACWDEYAACWRSAPIGEDPGPDYEATLLEHLPDARERANELIKAYRLHGEHGRIIREVSQVYGDLMKYSAYYLGNLAGQRQSWRDAPKIVEALTDHWFTPYFENLERALSDLAEHAGIWPDRSGFEAIGEIAEEVMAEGGMHFYESEGHPGEVGVSLPFSPETLPD